MIDFPEEYSASIDYHGSGGPKHRVIRSAISSGSLGPLTNGPDGEPALQQWYASGQVKSQRFYTDGLMHNGPNGEPATQTWYPDGQEASRAYFLNGVCVEGPDGSPSWMTWYRNGSLEQVAFYSNGELTNAPDGGPSVEAWFDDGQIGVQKFHQGGYLHDGPNGEPAFQRWYSSGRPLKPRHYIHGHKISVKDARWYQRNPEALKAVTESGITSERFDELLEECDYDVESAVMLARLMG